VAGSAIMDVQSGRLHHHRRPPWLHTNL